ncbi:MAG: neutral/alkaline non-lysosomal ceramidase N-terminal domain-containing protein [Kiritimatiellia bacterium]
MSAIALFTLFAVGTLLGAELRVGIGRAIMTPDTQPVYLAGYAARTTPSTGMLHHVWAKALVFEDSPSNRVALITLDLVGVQRSLRDFVISEAGARHQIDKKNFFFNASHTHSGPTGWPCRGYETFTAAEEQMILAQNRKFVDDVVAAVDMAVTNLAPARLYSGKGSAGFAINRRRRKVAPVDHTVPVLRIEALDGKVRAVLFNYACHNTTLTGGNLLINGDYAGFAMLELEAAYPGATALFLQGCGADQNPDPRGTVELARKYGHEMADAVRGVLAGEMRPVAGSFRTDFFEARLAFDVAPLDAYYKDGQSKNKYTRNRATKVLEAYNSGTPITSLPYPVQALRIGDDWALLLLGGEVVVDFALRAKQEYPQENLVVAGYSQSGGYIPSLRVLKEGGYEGGDYSMYSAFPGHFTEDVEESVFNAIHKVMDGVGAIAGPLQKVEAH